jgi:aminoglycoside phosphotransferase (APT) family kinase protein
MQRIFTERVMQKRYNQEFWHQEVLMSAGKMHVDEVDTDVSLVKRLLAAQFPQWADLPIKSIPSAGTDNAIYRLGNDMAVRLPRIHRATGQVDKEHQWLPQLAPHLPLAIPIPLALGTPGEGYPWHWSVYRWLKGENATIERIVDPRQAATDLAEFIAALQRVDATDGPSPGPHNSSRGVPLARREAATRAAIASLDDEIDVAAMTAAWDVALQAPEWQRPPVWIHGDLDSRNLLVENGRLSAVIDFGCLGVGDPACDVMVAWKVLSADTRDIFRTALSVDEATWARGRGWALSQSLMALSYYTLKTNPVLVREAQRWMAEVIADYKRNA